MASHLHVDIELLRAITEGRRDPGDLAAVALANLLEVCPTCRKAFEIWRRELEDGVVAPFLAKYDLAREDRCRGGRAEGVTSEGDEEEEEAPVRARELLALAPEERAERVGREPHRYAGATLAELLLDEARRHLPGRPREAHAVAVLAQAVLQHSETTPYAVELYARALVYQANALRAHGELRQADPLFQAARYVLKPLGGGHRLACAELDAFEGSLRRDQRRFEEALVLLRRALVTYRMEDRSEETVQVLLQLSTVH